MRESVSRSRPTRALEYGCGTGLLTFALREDLGEVTMADTSRGMLDVLREKIAAAGARNLHPVELDLLRDLPPAERFDLVYCPMTFHHVEEDELLLRRFRDLLLPGGHLCIADLEAETAPSTAPPSPATAASTASRPARSATPPASPASTGEPASRSSARARSAATPSSWTSPRAPCPRSSGTPRTTSGPQSRGRPCWSSGARLGTSRTPSARTSSACWRSRAGASSTRARSGGRR
ncbi:MAG: methyltransferase domain-containing protein [Planctomycetota bacterium]